MVKIIIISYTFNYFNNRAETGVASVEYMIDGVKYSKSFVRDLNDNKTTKDYIKPYHEAN